MRRRERRAGRLAMVGCGVALALAVGAPAARAEEPADPAIAIVRELAAIRGELHGISEMLSAMQQQQQLSALMARLQVKQSRAADIEGELRGVRSERDGQQAQLDELKAMEEAWFDNIDARAGNDEERDAMRRQMEMLQQKKKIIEERIENLRLRGVELENNLSRAQEDVQALEEAVDERLGLR